MGLLIFQCDRCGNVIDISSGNWYYEDDEAICSNCNANEVPENQTKEDICRIFNKILTKAIKNFDDADRESLFDVEDTEPVLEDSEVVDEE